MSTPRVFPPGCTIGIMGSGQLGRMFALAARRMGYRLQVFSPERNTPAGQVCDVEVCASYEDETAVRKFAQGVN
ncbi:MAG TPA: 5-(carboxyamino)imidazole ribonucleotide synthase, partial [Chthoniobacteraceae bacterium]|nr:5-(carboxyamino)imidazole ribonucleotide synthase [Chthoniobacteraceae bacterium]